MRRASHDAVRILNHRRVPDNYDPSLTGVISAMTLYRGMSLFELEDHFRRRAANERRKRDALPWWEFLARYSYNVAANTWDEAAKITREINPEK